MVRGTPPRRPARLIAPTPQRLDMTAACPRGWNCIPLYGISEHDELRPGGGWASRYPLSAGARIFTELMDGASHPVKALLQP